VIAGAGFAAVAFAWLAPTADPLRQGSVVIALSVAAAFVAEMARRDDRRDLVRSVSATVAGAVVAVMASGWIATYNAAAGQAARLYVALAAAAVGVASVVLPICGKRRLVGAILAVVVGAVAGFAVSFVSFSVSTVSGVSLGAVAGLAVAAAGLIFTPMTVPALRAAKGDRLAILNARLPEVAAGATPVAVAGMLAFTVRVMVG
jgi:hypothetical protein